ncbi:glycosyltransferase family 2 protein [uncultured Amphritea sp.]|uniref:glycosyltransferase family 2 protein n=1 Tax=uncultured Amphritea sp. TaxID=981605 RepID=UPI00262218FC|nr:glycosyltransferase family 2 protein [uncultured Amphritea sp.]
MNIAIAAIVKNEASYLLEWIAYHCVIGVSHFLIANNDSSDETPELLRKLADSGLVTTIDFPTKGDVKPQLPAYQKLLKKCPESIDLIAFIDADEYITVTDGSLTIHSVLDRLFENSEVSALAMNWACFGSAGQLFREEGMVIERFTRQSSPKFTANRNYKSIARRESIINFMNPHHINTSGGSYINTLGEPLDILDGKHGVTQHLVWDHLRVNHYVTKSLEEFVVGKSRNGSAATQGRKKHKQYFESHDRNEESWRYSDGLLNAVHELHCAFKSMLYPEVVPRSANVYFSMASDLRWGGSASSRQIKDLGVYKWHLDSPSNEGVIEQTQLGWKLVGWLLTENAEDAAYIIVQVGKGCEWRVPLMIKRPDVVREMCEGPMLTRHELCGFAFDLPGCFKTAKLYAEISGRRALLKEVTIQCSQSC